VRRIPNNTRLVNGNKDEKSVVCKRHRGNHYIYVLVHLLLQGTKVVMRHSGGSYFGNKQ